MSSLSQQIKNAADDIIKSLKKHGPLTQDQLFEKRSIQQFSYNGYSYGLDKALKDKVIEYAADESPEGDIIYQLKVKK